jgi:outer membrane protein insertion porin family
MERNRKSGRLWMAVGLAVSLGLPRVMPAAEASDPIERILVEGNQRLPDETVLSWITVQPGDLFDRERLRQEFRSLWKREVFSELSIEARDTPDGVVVIFHVRERPVISNVTYEGLKTVSVDQVEDVLQRFNATLPIGSPVSQTRIQRARELIKQLLQDAGRRSAEIDHELIPISFSQEEIRFLVNEGPKTKIKQIRFEGNEAIKSKQLRKAMQRTKESKWWKLFSRKDVLHQSVLIEDTRRLAALYQSEGYLDIQIRPERIVSLDEGKKKEQRKPEDDGNPGKKEKKKKKKKKEWVRIEIPVEEGARYRVGAMRVRGNTVFGDADLLARIPLRQGDIFNDSALNLGLSRLEQAYGERGYFYMTTNKILERQPDTTANVLIDVEEDTQYYVNRIEFRGNTNTRDAVLRREFRLHEEDLFNIQKFRTGLRRVAQLGYWRISEEPAIRPLGEEKKVDIMITGQEESRNEIQVGGGVSGVDGGFFSGSYATSNFLGRGEIFQAFLQVGGRRDLFNFSFIEPYLFGTDWTLGFNVFKRETQYTDLTQSSTGASVQFGRRLTDFSRFDFTYLFEDGDAVQQIQTTTLDPSGNLVSSPVLVESEFTSSSVIPSYLFDTRNNPFRPSRGFRFRASSEIAGGILGGDNYFVKPIVESTLYLPSVRNTYIGLNAEFGWVEPYGTLNGVDREVPVYERFFLGGERSLRAFETRTVGPTRRQVVPPTDIDGDGDFREEDANGNGRLDTEDINRNSVLDPGEDLNGNGILDTEDTDRDGILDRSVSGGIVTTFPGGNKFVLFNGEYIIPVGETVEMGFFIDAGNAFDDEQSIDLGDLRVDYGIEARFFLPIFQAPLRLIYGIIYDPRPGEDDSTFRFTIGRTF